MRTIEICWPAVTMSTLLATTGSRTVVMSILVAPLAPTISIPISYLSRLSRRSTEPKMVDRSGGPAAPLADASVGASDEAAGAAVGAVVAAAVCVGAAVVTVGAVVAVDPAHAPTTRATRTAAGAGRDRDVIGFPPGRPSNSADATAAYSTPPRANVAPSTVAAEPLGRPRLATERPVLAVAQRVVGLDEGMELARALVDDGRLRVPQIALHRELVAVAVRAVDLDRVEGRLDGVVRRVPLGERRLARVAQAVVLAPAGLEDEEPPDLGALRHVREHLLD